VLHKLLNLLNFLHTETDLHDEKEEFRRTTQLNFDTLNIEAQVHFLQTCINQDLKVELLDAMLLQTCTTSKIPKEFTQLENQPMTLHKLINFCYHLKPASRKQANFEQYLIYLSHLLQSFIAKNAAKLTNEELKLLQDQTKAIYNNFSPEQHQNEKVELIFSMMNYATTVVL